MKYAVRLIKLARERKGWTQAYLAQLIGKSPAAISMIESGEIASPPTLKLIADVLGLDMEDLIIDDQAISVARSNKRARPDL
jgi:transcriptional regulator with XRE-family HTH domain